MSTLSITEFVDEALRTAECVRCRLLTLADSERRQGRLDSLHTALRLASGIEGDFAWFADQYSQAIACARRIGRILGFSNWPAEAREWVIKSAEPLIAAVLRQSFDETESTCSKLAGLDDAIDRATYWSQAFFAAHNADQRMQRGVFFTPRPVAKYVVREVGQRLQRELGFASAWNDRRVKILDPALGSGVFLLEILDAAKQAADQGDADGIWQSLVQSLLPRLVGVELLLPNAVAAQLVLTAKLLSTGVQFPLPRGWRIYVVSTLADLADGECQSIDDAPLARGLLDANAARTRESFSVVIGNPPFSGVSSNPSRFAEQLLHGRDIDGQPVASYYEIDGQPLGERKHWLHDDYVKFLRYAHWQIERTDFGILGLVTNHGYLDNVTFRAVRRQLMQTFPQIDVLDLHGNRKKGEASNDATRDEGVFDVDQGTAIGLFCKPPVENGVRDVVACRVDHASLRGDRATKLAALSRLNHAAIARQAVSPVTPFYFFVPRNGNSAAEYAAAMKLTDVMPVNSTAAVTARDGFVVAFTREELLQRIEVLRDRSVSDDTIRERFFQNGRSRKYPPGDTRGWKLPEARERLRDLDDPASLIRTCQYRPFDRRYIIWADWMIDWPRTDAMRHMLDGNNLALVARRQAPAARPGDYFFVSDDILLDGLIRSDNRGSESFFPLSLASSESAISSDGDSPRFASNLSNYFLDRLHETMHASPERAIDETLDRLSVFYFLYAQFHADEYRRRFHDELQFDFPRVFVPRSRELFERLSELGRRLVDLHLLRSREESGWRGDRQANRIAAGFPRWRDGRLQLNADLWLNGVDEGTWSFRVGAWQVCRKWLADRRGRILTDLELDTYTRIVQAIAESRREVQSINDLIVDCGGWHAAFLTR